MIDLLRLCGFENQELESELPRIKKAFNKLGITPKDIERGKQRLNKYYDMELKGVRKAFGIYLRELVNLTLAKEEGKKKIIYVGLFPGCQEAASAAVYASDDVYATVPVLLYQVVFGCIFDKLIPITEAGEKLWLKGGGVAHCALLKQALGLYALELIPIPDLQAGRDIGCDGASKSGNLTNEFFGVPTFLIGDCNDRENKEFPGGLERGANYLENSLKRYTRKVGEVVGYEITDQLFFEVIQDRLNAGKAVAKYQALVEKSDPLVISATHETIVGGFFQLPLGRESTKASIDAANILYEELKERVSKGRGVVEKGAPRILGILPSSCAYPDLEHLLNEVGIALGVTETSLAEFDVRRDSEIGRVNDPHKLMAYSIWQSPVCHSVKARNAHIIGLSKRTGVDGVLNRYNIGCRITVGDAFPIKDAVTKELGIPVLNLAVECWDSRYFDTEQTRRKFELFRDIMKSRRAS
jgi:benzoyl-CoA reductase/2-hydroxyglutaryl-CoA dehydratase subunit BcrC/BadD/HgdB